MPIQTTDASSLTFNAANQQWIVKAGVVIAATADDSDAVNIPTTGGQLFNHGDISSTGGGVFGSHAIAVGHGANGALIINGDTGSVMGSTAIASQANDTHVFNDGTIIGFGSAAVFFDIFVERPEVHNAGFIHGKDAGIKGDTITSMKLFNSGVIESEGTGVALDLIGGQARIVNTGTISGAGSGVVSIGFGSTVIENTGKILGGVNLDGVDPDKMINNGLIRGDVVFSSGEDTYNGRQGVVDGAVFSGHGSDIIKGGGDDDEFFGQDGEDRLSGRGGDDVLVGGDRGDELKGGGGADIFVYENAGDSEGGFFAETTRDTIVDFSHHQGDRIDFDALDANLGNNHHFKFIGTTAFSGTKGELHYFTEGSHAILQADLSGDGKADIEIKLLHVGSLSAQDFHL